MAGIELESLNWNQLRVLDALLQTRSPTRAAERLGLTQSAVSHALAKLRTLFADPLLVRRGAEMVPTARADAMAGPLRDALLQLESALQPLDFDPRSARRTFRISAADYGQFVLLPRLTAVLQEQAPGIDLWLPPTGAEDEDAALADGGCDLVIGVPRRDGAGSTALHQRVLFEERFVCALRRDHPQVRGTLTLEDFCALPHAFVAPRGTPGGVVDQALAARGRQRRVAMMLPSFLVVPHVVAASDLVVTLAARLADAFAHALPLQIVEPPVPLPGFRIVMRWHERHHRDPGHAWLRQQISAVAAGGMSSPDTG
ncbi:MAG: LysR family transcriptional regulator [Deltaproteobacteria bacterium]|nr:LysR family transcriptional regulator [Deltaproteobacteria bacterium]